MMTIISMTKKQFLSFEAFCQNYKYDYKVIQRTDSIYQISCKKKCVEHFRQSKNATSDVMRCSLENKEDL